MGKTPKNKSNSTINPKKFIQDSIKDGIDLYKKDNGNGSLIHRFLSLLTNKDQYAYFKEQLLDGELETKSDEMQYIFIHGSIIELILLIKSESERQGKGFDIYKYLKHLSLELKYEDRENLLLTRVVDLLNKDRDLKLLLPNVLNRLKED